MRAKRIVESLLRFSRRPRDEEKGPVDLVEGARGGALPRRSRSSRKAASRSSASYGAAVARGNANQLQQIALNLLVNAIQAMAGVGRAHRSAAARRSRAA